MCVFVCTCMCVPVCVCVSVRVCVYCVLDYETLSLLGPAIYLSNVVRCLLRVLFKSLVHCIYAYHTLFNKVKRYLKVK